MRPKAPWLQFWEKHLWIVLILMKLFTWQLRENEHRSLNFVLSGRLKMYYRELKDSRQIWININSKVGGFLGKSSTSCTYIGLGSVSVASKPFIKSSIPPGASRVRIASICSWKLAEKFLIPSAWTKTWVTIVANF